MHTVQIALAGCTVVVHMMFSQMEEKRKGNIYGIVGNADYFS